MSTTLPVRQVKNIREAVTVDFFIFLARGEDFPLDIDIFRVNVENGDNKKVWELTFNHNQLHTYNDFFTTKPPRQEFETEQKLVKIYYALKEGNKEGIERFILPEARSEFPWRKLNHQYWASPWSSYLN